MHTLFRFTFCFYHFITIIFAMLDKIFSRNKMTSEKCFHQSFSICVSPCGMSAKEVKKAQAMDFPPYFINTAIQWFIVSEPFSCFLRKTIENVVRIITGQYNGEKVLTGFAAEESFMMIVCSTGPGPFTAAIRDHILHGNLSESKYDFKYAGKDFNAVGGQFRSRLLSHHPEQHPEHYSNIMTLFGQNILQTYSVMNSSLPSAEQNRLQLPHARTSMQDLDIFLASLELGIPFSFASFDGTDISAVNYCTEGKDIFRGRQRCTQRFLHKGMINALTNRAPNLYVGIPCLCEHNAVPFLQILARLNITYTVPSTQEKYPSGHGTMTCMNITPNLTIDDLQVSVSCVSNGILIACLLFVFYMICL